MSQYNLEGEKRCIILDYINAEIDVEVFKKTFEFLNFTVDCPLNNQLSLEITRQLFKKASQSNHGQCLVVVIICTGDENGFYTINKEYIELEEIFNNFNDTSCIELKNKPKLFFIKGITLGQHNFGLKDTVSKNKNDFFVCFSTFSEFLLTFCNVIFSKHRTYDLMQIFYLVNEISYDVFKEKCSFISTLTKRLKF